MEENGNPKNKYYVLPESGHYIHFDNPISLVNLIANDCLGTNLEVGKDITRDYKQIWLRDICAFHF